MDTFLFYLYKFINFLKERNNLVVSESNQSIIVGPRNEDNQSYKLLAMRSRVSEFRVWSL